MSNDYSINNPSKEGLEQYGQRFLDSFAPEGGQTYKNVMLRRTMCAQPNPIVNKF